MRFKQCAPVRVGKRHVYAGTQAKFRIPAWSAKASCHAPANRRAVFPSLGIRHRIRVILGTVFYFPYSNRPERRSQLQRSAQVVIPATGKQRKQARGCERLERELWAGDFPLTVWPTSMRRSLSAVTGPSEAKRPTGFHLREGGTRPS